MRKQSGAAYLFLLFLLVLMAVSALAVGTLEHYARIRSNEAELLRIGAEFRLALIRYRTSAPPHVYPRSLEELLLDERSGKALRHLRRIHVDPITGKSEWGLVREQGSIVGVYSLAEGRPMKTAGFDPDDAEFEGAQKYSDWVFRVVPLKEDLTPQAGIRLQGATGR